MYIQYENTMLSYFLLMFMVHNSSRQYRKSWAWSEKIDQTSKQNMAASQPTLKVYLLRGIAGGASLWWFGPSLKVDKLLRRLTIIS